ncbi:MAG TPA: serine hydrolase domain-containing protein [Sphingomonas sp.]|nr:serine hydrolase domain-containing protein [Sphingomonas sp.]
MELAKPEDHGFDAGRLAAIDAFLAERYVDSGRFANTQLLIGRDDAIVHFTSNGAAREGAATPVDARTIYRIASMTKPVTSVAFMQLLEEGRVALDTPVHHILPELEGVGVYAGGGGDTPFTTMPTVEPMRMVDLLRHTAGLTYGFQERTPIDAAYRTGRIENWHGNLDLDGFVAALGELPLEFSPGEAWNYSVATDVLGLVVQRIAGKPLGDVFRDRIFAPLGMDDTGFVVPDDQVDRLPDCYAFVPGKGRILYDRGAESAWRHAPKLASGGGGLVSTSLDYHRFCRMLLNKGTLDGARILSRKSIDLMTMNHLPGGRDLASMSRSLFSESTNAGVGFGLGFAVTTNVAPTLVPGSVGEFYWGGMFSTAFFVDPVERIIMIFMTQMSPSSTYPVRREIKTLIYSALT